MTVGGAGDRAHDALVKHILRANIEGHAQQARYSYAPPARPFCRLYACRHRIDATSILVSGRHGQESFGEGIDNLSNPVVAEEAPT